MVSLDNMEPQLGVLGSIMLEPKFIGQCAATLRPEDFINPRCRLIYKTILDMFREGKEVDPMLVRGRLSDIPGIGDDLLAIVEQTPTVWNVWAYAAQVREQGTLAALREQGRLLSEAKTLDAAQEAVDRANGAMSARPGTERVSARRLLEDFMDRHGEGRAPDYYSWGFSKLDGGLFAERGDMILLGGYPSAGKTALALQFAWHMAKARRVGFYSLETKPAKLADRSVAALAGIDMGSIKKSSLTEQQWEQLALRSGELAGRSLDMISAGGMSVGDLRADALGNRYEVVFIDYLQLLRSGRTANRTEAVTEISIGLHQLAQGNGVTVIALSQLRRPETGKEFAPPTMSSLRESGQLEQDADIILLLHRAAAEGTERVLRVAKNKEGTLGKIRLDFDGKRQRFSEGGDAE